MFAICRSFHSFWKQESHGISGRVTWFYAPSFLQAASSCVELPKKTMDMERDYACQPLISCDELIPANASKFKYRSRACLLHFIA